jgi:hypothetical protein
MNQTSSFAPAMSCKADQALETVRQTLALVVKILKAIAHSARTLAGFFTLGGTVLENAIPENRPEQKEANPFQTVLALDERISSYAELQRLIHDALRLQHPEWIGLNGQSEMCEFYEARFAKLLGRGENTVEN